MATLGNEKMGRDFGMEIDGVTMVTAEARSALRWQETLPEMIPELLDSAAMAGSPEPREFPKRWEGRV